MEEKGEEESENESSDEEDRWQRRKLVRKRKEETLGSEKGAQQEVTTKAVGVDVEGLSERYKVLRSMTVNMLSATSSSLKPSLQSRSYCLLHFST